MKKVWLDKGNVAQSVGFNLECPIQSRSNPVFCSTRCAWFSITRSSDTSLCEHCGHRNHRSYDAIYCKNVCLAELVDAPKKEG